MCFASALKRLLATGGEHVVCFLHRCTPPATHHTISLTAKKLFLQTATIAAVAVSAVSGIQAGIADTTALADTYEIDQSEMLEYLQARVDAANAAGDTYEIDVLEMAHYECDGGDLAACELAAELTNAD